jgi:ribosomal-protein-alanine N-acetyltransferase
MNIRSISRDETKDFIDCYIKVFETLMEILPQGYVINQIEKASKQDFQNKLLSIVDDSNSILLVATDYEKIIGLVWGNVKEDGSGWLGFLGVLEAFRRMGVGRALLCRFIEECIERGVLKISLDTDPRLIPAINLYESMGFVREGFVKNPYGMKLILFSKELNKSNPNT